jgi:hypothetical protein
VSASSAERLAYSVDETAHLTGLSRDLLYDEMRRGTSATARSADAASSLVSTSKNSSDSSLDRERQR